MSSRKCRLTGKEIPKERHGSAQYYSSAEYKEAKKERSKKRYKSLKVNHDEEKRNENLLVFFYNIVLMGKHITFQDMINQNFNFGFVTRESEHEGKLLKVVGSYSYHIDPKTKNVQIWKLNTKK